MDLGDVLDLVVDVDDVGADGVGGLGVNMDLGGVLDLVVDVDVDCGHGSSSIGNSMGGSNNWGSSVGGSRDNSRGSNNSGGVRSYSSISSSQTSVSSSKTSISSNKSRVSHSSKTGVSKELGISISCRGSKGGSHEGRQSDEGSHSDL